MPRGSQPRCIVQRAASDAGDPIPRQPANPRTALRANQSGVDAPAIGCALKSTRLDPRQVEPVLGNNDAQGKRGSGQTLAIQAVAGIDCLVLLSDLVANLPALATARLWELHRSLP